MEINKKNHYGDYAKRDLKNMTQEDLINIILNFQKSDNFIIMTDSYKMTHHLLTPNNLQEVYSYMESRGGEMPYTIFLGLQYYLKKYIAGIRITKDKIEEARQLNIKHFGFDCFDSDLWNYILEKYDGKLPLEIKAIPEGTPIKVKNILMSIRNTDKRCGALTNITETLLMKLWATNTVATYNRMIKTLILKYAKLTSDLPLFLSDFNHHDFGYRGTSSEETARLMGMSALTSFKGTDTLGAIKLIQDYYYGDMPGYSVIATEHMVVCSYGSREEEYNSYKNIINNVKEKFIDIDTPTKTIILSLVSDTYNIYNVCNNILPSLRNEFIGWENKNGCKLKIVVRPDSGDPKCTLFGYKKEDMNDSYYNILNSVKEDMNISMEDSIELLNKGVFGILFDKFGYTINNKGFKVLNDQIGILQGDGVSMKVIEDIYIRMVLDKIDTMTLVFGSGGKNLQAHDRDEQKYAIKATHVIVNDNNINVQKKPATDPGKESKTGYLKLNKTGHNWNNYETISSTDGRYNDINDYLETVYINGDIIKEYTFDEVIENCKINEDEY